MTQDEIIRMAREAGFSSREDSSHMYAQSEFDKEICFEEYAIGERVARFAALVAAHEREKQAEQEPVEKEIAAAVLDHCYGYSAVNDDMIERTSVVVKKILDKHAAPQPVRTKDLTDGAIWEILETHPADIITAIRAVIAADRSKNK